MTTEKSELIERILENYVLGHISRKQLDAMIEAVERHKASLGSTTGKEKNPKAVMYMRVGNESQLK